MDDRQNEQWRDVPGWEGLYAVSSLGRIWSHPRAVESSGAVGNYETKGKIRSLWKDRKGYLRVNFQRMVGEEREKVNFFVHRLVALAFLPPRTFPEDWDVGHVDGNRMNNSEKNLSWQTKEETLRHALDNGALARYGSVDGDDWVRCFVRGVQFLDPVPSPSSLRRTGIDERVDALWVRCREQAVVGVVAT